MSLDFLPKSNYWQRVYVRLNSKHTNYQYGLVSPPCRGRQLWTAVVGNVFCLVKSDVLFYHTVLHIIPTDRNNSIIFNLLPHFSSDEIVIGLTVFSLKIKTNKWQYN